MIGFESKTSAATVADRVERFNESSKPSIPMRIKQNTKDRIEKMRSLLRLKNVKINQRQLIDNAVEFAYFHEDDFIVYLTSSKVSLEEDTLWQLIHNPVDMGKTDAEKVDEYLYGGD